jgi:hypothetical protein
VKNRKFHQKYIIQFLIQIEIDLIGRKTRENIKI